MDEQKTVDEMASGAGCAPGTERYERYLSPPLGGGRRRYLVQYDYRTPEGVLFSTVAPDLETCRWRRDEWLRGYNRSKS